MSIRKIISPDMPTAMRRVRAELGPDAVIIGSQPVPCGVEVAAQAAGDAEDDAAVDVRSVRRWAEALKQRAAGAALGADGALASARPRHAKASGDGLPDGAVPARREPPAEAPAGDDLARMRQELQALRTLVEMHTDGENGEPLRESSSVARAGVEAGAVSAPVVANDNRIVTREHADVMSRMLGLGLERDLCGAIAARVHAEPCADSAEDRIDSAFGILTSSIPVSAEDILETGGVIALLGATGVGKTTTAAKLVAQFTERHGPHKVALVTTDNLRIGAREQLRLFARAMACPVLTADSASTLAEILKGLAGKQLVVVDTAGINHRDVSLSEQLAAVDLAPGTVDCYAVLSATTESAAQAACLRALAAIPLAGCIISKTDDATTLGGALTSIIRHKLPVSHITNGPRVPGDIERANASALVSSAVELADQTEAERFAEPIAWAALGQVAGL